MPQTNRRGVRLLCFKIRTAHTWNLDFLKAASSLARMKGGAARLSIVFGSHIPDIAIVSNTSSILQNDVVNLLRPLYSVE